MRSSRWAFAGLLGWCTSGCALESNVPPSANPEAGSPARDAGASADAGRVGRDGSLSDSSASSDAGQINGPGVYVSPLPVTIIGATPAPREEVLYVRGDGTLSAATPSGDKNLTLGLRPEVAALERSTLWLWTELGDQGAHGTLSAYQPGTSTVATLGSSVAADLIWASPSGTSALVAAEWTRNGSTAQDLVFARLTLVRAEGGRRAVLARQIVIGRWDPASRKHTGPCTAAGALVHDGVALIAACTARSPQRRQLLAIDLVNGSTTTAAQDVLAFVELSPDRRFALFADASLHLFAYDISARTVLPVEDQSPVGSLIFLDDTRFAYSTANGRLSLVTWPTLEPRTLVPTGVDAIEAASPSGEQILFRNERDPSGLRDLWLVATGTAVPTAIEINMPPDAYPGDDPFSLDGRWVRWFSMTDDSFIGTVVTRRTEGAGDRIELAARGSGVFETADPARVLLLANAHRSPQSRRVIADLALRASDGSDQLRILVPAIDAAGFILFPARDKAAFVIPDGPQAGLWIDGILP